MNYDKNQYKAGQTWKCKMKIKSRGKSIEWDEINHLMNVNKHWPKLEDKMGNTQERTETLKKILLKVDPIVVFPRFIIHIS